MAKNSGLQELVSNFAAQIEALVARQANEAFAARFDDLKAQLLGGGPIAPRASSSAAAAPAHRKPGRPKGSRSHKPAQMKPSPVSGVLNKARRFSYLLPEERTAENLKKFRGASRGKAAAGPAAAVPAKRGPGRPRKNPLPAAPAAAPVKRGPGRPRKNPLPAAAPAAAKA